MITDEIFKRRKGHNNTPQSILLIITNFIVTLADVTLFAGGKHIHWFFWVIVFLLAVYNFFVIRRNIEEFNSKIVLGSYIVSILVLIALFFILKH